MLACTALLLLAQYLAIVESRLIPERTDGTCCRDVASCGGVHAANVGGWGHVPSDLRFSFTKLNGTNTVANSYLVNPKGNKVESFSGWHIPICAQHNIIYPTKYPAVKAPPPPPPPPPPVVPTMQCWDGTVCPGRKEVEGYQCCSAPVMAGITCAQIFVCDQKRTCTGKRACYQAYTSPWDKNNNGWELAAIVAFIIIMLVFVCLFCLYCCCDRCIINRRKYAAMRERKRYMKNLPNHQNMQV